MPYLYVPEPEGVVYDHKLEFFIDLMPLPWARPIPRATKDGKYYEYTPPDQKKFQDLVRTIFYEYCHENSRCFDYPFDGVMYLTTHHFFPKLKKLKDIYHPCDINKDWDNLGKQICDALQAMVKIRLSTADPITGRKSKWIRRFGAWDNDKDVILGLSGKHWTDPIENRFGTSVQILFFRRTYEPIPKRRR